MTEVFPHIGISFQKTKTAMHVLPPLFLLVSLGPFQVRTPWCRLLSPPLGVAYQGQEGQMRLLADMLLIQLFVIPLSVCQGFRWWQRLCWWGSNRHHVAGGICLSNHPVAFTSPLPAQGCHVPLSCHSHVILHTPAFSRASYLITNHFEYHDHQLI